MRVFLSFVRLGLEDSDGPTLWLSPQVLSWELRFRNQPQDVGCTSTAPKRGYHSQTEVRTHMNMYTYIYIHVYIYIYVFTSM